MNFWRAAKDNWVRLTEGGGLTVLAYHRVGDRAKAAFDPGVFTTDEAQLEAQVRFFQKHHRIVDLEEALSIASGQSRSRSNAILLTFDDGYLDNYQTGYPLLRSLGAPAVFFLVSGYLTGEMTAWWDRIAWLVKTAKSPRLLVPDEGGVIDVDLREVPTDQAINRVLEVYKAGAPEVRLRILDYLESTHREVAEPPCERQFLGVAEARELRAGGMAIGAHTHSHRILSSLDQDEQRQELASSRAILEAEIGCPVEVLAYPVGGGADFTGVTKQLARDCGFRAAFSCHGGANRRRRADLYDIKRAPIYWGARPDWLAPA